MPAQWHYRTLAGPVAGFVLWGTYFVLVYGLMSVACRYIPAYTQLWGMNAINLGLGIVSIATLLAIGALALAAQRGRRRARDEQTRFLATIALLSDLVSLLGTLWIGAGLLIVPPCL